MENKGLSLVKLPERKASAAALSAQPRQYIRVIEILNPFRPDERAVTEIDALANESLGALLYRAGYDAEHFEASINGGPVPTEASWRTTVKPGSDVVLFPRAAGGGFFKNVGMMLLVLAAGALAAYGGWLLAGFFLFPSSAALITMTAAIAGSIGASVVSWALAPGQPSQPAFSLTYDPTGPKGLAQPGVPVPKAYGKMGWCGNIISSYVNYDGPNAYIYALACYGFGQAANLGNILINNKPISEYTQCTYTSRLGTNDQTPIPGFNQTVNGFPQETQVLAASAPVTVPGTGTDVQGLQITIKYPSGCYHITNDGNYVPLKVVYQIQISPHGEDLWTDPLFVNETESIAHTDPDGHEVFPQWVVVPTDRFVGSGIVYAYDNGTHTPGDPWTGTSSVATVNLDGSSSSTSYTFFGEWQPCDPSLEQVEVLNWWQGYRVAEWDSLSAFFDTTSIYGLTAGQWDVQVTKIGYYDNDGILQLSDPTVAQYVDDTWLWNINEISLSDLAYPNMVLIGVQALATSQMSGAALQIQATITHDIGADTVLPLALSGFEHDNPAIVAYDVLANPLYGMGVSAANIDVPAFVAWAEFCDEYVTNQNGLTARRFIFNGVFDQLSDAWKTLQTIGNMSRAAVIQLGMRYSVVIDAPAQPVQLFTVGNTKKDSFKETWLSLDDRTTLIECDFADAARNYRMDLPVSVMTAEDLNSGLAPKPTRTKLIGCTDRDQAWRWSYFHLLSTKLAERTVQFEAPVEACACKLGSVIGVQADVTQWASGGRIRYGSTLNTLVVDRSDITFAPASGYTVSVQHPAIQRGAATVLSISGLIVTMTAALPSGRILKAVGPDGTEYIVTGSSGSAITLANTTGTLAAGQSVALYDVNVIDVIDVEAWTPTATGGVLTVVSNFQAVPTPDSAWVYGASAGYQPAKEFRVINMKKSGDFDFQISALEYNEDVYADVTPNYGEIVGTPNTSPAILNLTLTEQFQNGTLTGNTNSAVVAVGWQNGNTAVGGLVQVQANGGGSNSLGKIQGQGCTFVGVVGTTYTVTVTGFDWAGNILGNPVSASITVEAATSAPANVTGFTGNQTTGGSVLTWTALTTTPDHYEIRYADNGSVTPFTQAEVLWDGTGTTWTDTTVRSGTYMIVAVGPASSGSVMSVTPATWQPPQQALFDDTDLAPGQSLSVSVSANVVVIPPGTFSQVTLSCPSQALERVDGTVLAVPSQSPNYGGLTRGGTYYFYIGVDRTTGTLTVIGPLTAPNSTYAATINGPGYYAAAPIVVTAAS
jgi:predicted phage tail protein